MHLGNPRSGITACDRALVDSNRPVRGLDADKGGWKTQDEEGRKRRRAGPLSNPPRSVLALGISMIPTVHHGRLLSPPRQNRIEH